MKLSDIKLVTIPKDYKIKKKLGKTQEQVMEEFRHEMTVAFRMQLERPRPYQDFLNSLEEIKRKYIKGYK